MRKLLRNIARSKLKDMGCDHINKRLRYNWRRVIGAYPVNVVTGERMNDSYHGTQEHKPGDTRHLFSYAMKPMKAVE